MNRNFIRFLVAAFLLLALVFLLPFIWPVDKQWYFGNLNWLIPLIIAIFVAPLVTFSLSRWDIHFYFDTAKDYPDTIQTTIVNSGDTPFNFNLVQFTTGKKFFLFGKRQTYPSEGISDEQVVFHGAGTRSQTLSQTVGCTIRKGMPIKLIVRGNLSDYLSHFQGKKVNLCLFFKGTNQRVYSNQIPSELISKILKNFSQKTEVKES